MGRSVEEELVRFLSDMYSVEQQALAQLVSAPEIARDPWIAEDFRQHHIETQRQAERVRARLEARGGEPSAIKDAVMNLGGKGFLLFARALPETPGRLVAHAYSYEAMEWAGYAMLERIARRAGDEATVEVARAVGAEERAMMERLEGRFDGAEEASHGETAPERMDEEIRKHLAEAHALERQSEALLEKSTSMGGDPELGRIYREHLEESRGQAALIEARLDALGGRPSAFKDAAMGMGGLNWSVFFAAQSDTPAKLAAFAYAFEHLEIAGYELLRRSAGRTGDAETQRMCDRILTEERAMAERLAQGFDRAVQATLEGAPA